MRSLTKKSEFTKVYEGGVKKVGRFVVVYLLCEEDSARAFVASRKVGNAVKRNRGKRLMREAFRNGALGNAESFASVKDRFFPKEPRISCGRENTGKEPQGLWVVLVARHKILTACDHEVREELNYLLGE